MLGSSIFCSRILFFLLLAIGLVTTHFCLKAEPAQNFKKGHTMTPSWIPHKDAGRCRLARCPLSMNHPSIAPRRMCMYLFPGKSQSMSSDAHMTALGSQNKATGWGPAISVYKASQRRTEHQPRWHRLAGRVTLLIKICACPIVGFWRAVPAPA